MKQIFLIILTIGCLTINSGCYQKVEPIPQDIFNNVKIFEKPKETNNIYDVYDSYIKLYNIYNNNKIILDSLKNMNK